MTSNSSHLDTLSIGGTQSLLSLNHPIAWCLRCSGYVKGFYRFYDEALAYFVDSSRVPAPSVDVYDTRATSQSCQGDRYGLMLPGTQCPLHQNRLLWARHGGVRDRGYQVARVQRLDKYLERDYNVILLFCARKSLIHFHLIGYLFVCPFYRLSMPSKGERIVN